MLARVRFYGRATEGPQTSEAERVFTPVRVLQERAGQRAVVWLVDKGRGVAVRRDVTLGSGTSDDWIEVVSGLKPGDAVIDPLPAGLSDGDAVSITGEAR